MIEDARTIPAGTVLKADLCIVGAGAAGIAMARALIGRPMRIILLEAGGDEYDDATQALYAGTREGNPCAPLDVSRLRYFGGTTNHWAGYCRPFDESDFERRAWVGMSGWPFDLDHLVPFYERAQPVLELQAFDYEAATWAEHMSGLFRSDVMQGRLRAAVFQQSPPTRLGPRYRDELAKARNVTVYQWANLTDIRTDRSPEAVSAIDVACLEGPHFRIEADRFVLAMGGIENARMLLSATSTHAAGLGNGHDMVGRCFMDHPHYEAAQILFNAPSDIARSPTGQIVYTQCMLDQAVEREEELLRFLTTLHPVSRQSPGYVALRNITKNLRRGIVPESLWDDLVQVVTDIDGAAMDLYGRLYADTNALELTIHPEQEPNRASRVTLTDERDALGLRRCRLDWRLTDLDRRTIRRGLEIVGEEFGRAGIGRLQLAPWVEEDGFEVPGNGSYHHIGTTRMSTDPKQGVVDADCRVHGLQNLYVAGSSVFPTAGFANPTLTIVALALRLADHLDTTTG